ncbi:MAG: hypothetical protein IIW54_06810 [Lachnospiraceae bacterium]|nr:hypothetical protein [Lachnospiraceae bacterium]
MKPNYTSRSGLFLIELIISIFFFIVASAIVIQLFAKAHFISTDAIDINHALFHTQNISEIFIGNNGDFKSLKTEYTETLNDTNIYSITDNELIILFDKKWNPTIDTSTARYMIYVVSDNPTDNFSEINIFICHFRQNFFAENYSNTSLALSINDKDIIHNQKITKYIGGNSDEQ